MKYLKVIAWIGLGIMTLGVIGSFSTSFAPVTPYGGGVDFGHPVAIVLGFIGAPLMLIGGLIAKPRFFWLGSIIIGCLFIASFFPNYRELQFRIGDGEFAYDIRHGGALNWLWQFIGMPLVSGLLVIAEGIFLKIRKHRFEKQNYSAQLS